MFESGRTLVLAAVVYLLAAGVAGAEKGDAEVGFRLMYVTASATGSGSIDSTGSSPTLSSGPGVEIDWILWPLDELTLELSAAISPHSVGTSGGELAGTDGGTLWRIPLSAVAQYRPDLYGPFDPYVGLGLVYNLTSYRMSSGYDELFSKGSFSNDLDIVAQVGLNYTLDVRWSANLDVRYMGMKTTGTFTAADGTSVQSQFSLNPWVIGLGFRYRY
jgi:outer membrane protein